jgi:hypothetical protein
LFHGLALAVCAQEGIDLRFNHLDTTNFSHSGESVHERSEQAMTISYGSAYFPLAIIDDKYQQPGGGRNFSHDQTLYA